MSTKILVVDEDPNIVRILNLVLEMSGFDVATAFNDLEGIQLANTCHPDLIVLSIQVDPRDGLNFCSALKDNRKTSAIPIILMAEKGAVIGQRIATRAGAAAVIAKPFTKPFSPRQLVDLIEEVLEDAANSMPW